MFIMSKVFPKEFSRVVVAVAGEGEAPIMQIADREDRMKSGAVSVR